MRKRNDLISRNEMAKFLEELQELTTRYSDVVKGAELMLDMAEEDDQDTEEGIANFAENAEASTAKTSRCNPPCPHGMRCVLLVPSLQRVCVKR